MLGFGFSLGATNVDDSFRLLPLKETVKGECTYPSGNTCEATSTIVATTINAVGSVSYTWTTDNGTIESGAGTDTITLSTDSDTDQTINVTCVANDTATDSTKTLKFVQEHKQNNAFLQLINKVDYFNLVDKVSKLILKG
jgi:hypothetical protein